MFSEDFTRTKPIDISYIARKIRQKNHALNICLNANILRLEIEKKIQLSKKEDFLYKVKLRNYTAKLKEINNG